MDLGASMTHRRAHQPENDGIAFYRGLVIGVPCSIALALAVIWLWAAVCG